MPISVFIFMVLFMISFSFISSFISSMSSLFLSGATSFRSNSRYKNQPVPSRNYSLPGVLDIN